MIKMVNFMLCIFYHIFKKRPSPFKRGKIKNFKNIEYILFIYILFLYKI